MEFYILNQAFVVPVPVMIITKSWGLHIKTSQKRKNLRPPRKLNMYNFMIQPGH